MNDALTPSHPTSRTITAALLILLVAAGLRLYRLPELPVGLHYDEAANGILADEIAQGNKTPIFISSYTGKETLFFYWTALWIRLLGRTTLALRLSAALIGLATIAATIWAIRELLAGQRGARSIALVAGAFLATSFWHLILSRYGFRAITQPLLQALTVAALWRALRLSKEENKTGAGSHKERTAWILWLVLAGLFCGLTAYTYLAARAFPIPLAAALLALHYTDRDHRQVRLGQSALFVVVAALILAPLAYYWLTHPGSFLTRVGQVGATNGAEVWAGLRACLGMFFLRGDPYVRFNIPGRPLFDPITAVLFVLGIISLFRKPNLEAEPARSSNRHPVQRPLHYASRAFLLTYLPVMLLPSALAVGDITPSNLRAAGLLPFVYLFPALGLSTLGSALLRLWPQTPPRWATGLRSWALVYIVLALMTPITAVAYFRDWASSADLYHASDGDLADVAAFLNQADLSATTPYVASIHYRHPTLAFLAKDYGAVRWLTGGSTAVFPAQGKTLLVFPHSAAQHLTWIETLLPDGSRIIKGVPLSPDDKPAFYAYRVATPMEDTTAPGDTLIPTHPLTANLAHVIQVLGYDVVGQPRSGESLEVAIWWRVRNLPNAGDYGPVARLTDHWGFTWGETQPFHYPSEQWTPGELVIDRLSIPVAPGTPPGDYVVRFSLYSASANSSLPVLSEAGRYAGIAVRLPVHLTRAAAPPDPQALPIRRQLDALVDGLTLLGYNLDTTTALPGERIYLTLFWKAERAARPDLEVVLTLNEASLYAGGPVGNTYPTSEWTTGEIVLDRYALRVPRQMEAGDFPLQLAAGDPATDSGPTPILELGTVTVAPIDRTFDIPPIAYPLTATLGSDVLLLGYDLSSESAAPGDTLTLTLFWQALAEMEEDYTVFTHLLAPDGSTTAQRDNHPVQGTYPTSLWTDGQIVTDVYELVLGSDAPLGPHRLEVGMYAAETGDRLPTGTPDDAITLQTITIANP
jgi:hypothetical protein